MDIKHLQFSFRMYWANMKGLLNMVAEGIILVASLASLFILVYQFGFKYSAHVTHMLETSRVYLLLAFFTGISLRYILKFKEIIQEKMLYLDIGIYFFLFAVLSGKVFFKEAIHQSLPYLGFLTEPLFVYFLLLLLSAIHLSRQTFTLLQSHIKPSLLFLLSFVFVILVGSGLLMLPNATVHGIHFVDALFISTTSVCVTGLTTVDVATTFTHRTYHHHVSYPDRRYRSHDFHQLFCPFFHGAFIFHQQARSERHAERRPGERAVPGDP